MPPAPHVVVLAAGEGKRLRARVPKVLMPIWGRPSVRWPVEAALAAGAARVTVVGGEHLPALQAALAGLDPSASGRLAFARQERPLGTGHALLAARAELPADGNDPVVVLYGDCPLTTPDLVSRLLAAHAAGGAAITIVTVELDQPTGYGRVVREPSGVVARIVEERDATPAERGIREVNTGVWVLRAELLAELEQVGSANAQGEVYLTDLVGRVRQRGLSVAALPWSEPLECLGFNDQRELAVVRAVLRRRILAAHLANGVEIVDPDTTFIDADVAIEPGARILPCTMIEGDCRIATGCEVGPFSHLRAGSVLHEGAEVGNFTETKQSVLGAHSKAKHLTYLGDAVVGARANIGAGTITANYDGKHKHRTRIADRAFIGSGTVIVAPAGVGEGATTGAGAVVRRHSEIPAGETWVGVPAKPIRKAGPGA